MGSTRMIDLRQPTRRPLMPQCLRYRKDGSPHTIFMRGVGRVGDMQARRTPGEISRVRVQKQLNTKEPGPSTQEFPNKAALY